MKVRILVHLSSRTLARWRIWGMVVVCALTCWPTYPIAAEDHTYLDEGHVLMERLVEILVEEHVCASTAACRSQGGYALYKPLKHGIRVSIYGINSDHVAARLLQACAASFVARPLGQEITVEIFRVKVLDRNSQPFFNKPAPNFTLKLEKNK